MKRLTVYTCLLIALIALSACNNTPSPSDPLPTAILPDPPTLEATEPAALPTMVEPESAEATPTVETTATVPPTPTAEPPTAEPTATEPAATEEAPTATAEPTASPVPESVMAPGQRDTAELAEGEFHTYLVDSLQFRPSIFFVEPSRDLDVELLAITGELPAGSGLDSVTPAASADNALAGRPEIVVLSPDADGRDTFVVRAVSGSGDYTAYLFNLTSPATGMAIQQSDTLAASETKTYSVTSNGARPVIAMADPTNLSDVVLDIFGSDGTLITTANFSGAGGVEVAYVLPLGTATYTIAVREVNGMPSNFDVAVVTLE